MDDKKGKAPADINEEQDQVSEAPAKKEPVFSLERLRRDCLTVLGVSTSTFDGATFGLTGEFTLENIRGIIKEWQNKPLFKTEKEDKK